MNREQAIMKFNANRRFASTGGKVLVRDVELLAAIALLKAARPPAQLQRTGIGSGLIG